MPEVAEAQVDWKKVGAFIHELFGVSFHEQCSIHSKVANLGR